MSVDRRTARPTMDELMKELSALQAAEARRRESNVEDVALSSWADGKMEQLIRLQIKLVSHGWLAWFAVGLKDANTGEPVAAKRIMGRFGWCWAVTDAAGKFTGVFVTDKKSSLDRRGLAVRYERAPAYADLRGTSVTSVGPVVLRVSDDLAGGLLTEPGKE